MRQLNLGERTTTVTPMLIPATGEPSLRFSLNKCIEWSVKDRKRLVELRDWLVANVGD